MGLEFTVLDVEILKQLQVIKCAQQELRQIERLGKFRFQIFIYPDAALGAIARALDSLPEDIAKKLTELPLEAVAPYKDPYCNVGTESGEAQLKEDSLAACSDEAFAQVIRAANVYRERCGFTPLDENGNADLLEVYKC